MFEYLETIQFKDWAGSVIGAIIALGGVIYGQRQINQRTQDQREHEEVKAERTADISQAQDFTARFRALMDGYEARIIDLTNEVRDTKAELREARAEIARLRERLDAG